MSGSPDKAVYAKANELSATLITNDQGFADIRHYPPSSSKGIIILKILPDLQSVQAVHKVLNRLLINEFIIPPKKRVLLFKCVFCFMINVMDIYDLSR